MASYDAMVAEYVPHVSFPCRNTVTIALTHFDQKLSRAYSVSTRGTLKPCFNGVWLGQTSRFVLVDCGRLNSKSRTVPTALGFANISAALGCIGAVWPLYFPLMRELFTAITREATDALTSPQATSILSVPTTGNNANRGRNSWKDRPVKRSSTYCQNRPLSDVATSVALGLPLVSQQIAHGLLWLIPICAERRRVLFVGLLAIADVPSSIAVLQICLHRRRNLSF
ncbi:hypothetical protein AVEN_203490-1 [Araneus ventricosus]|uniref:Uncharacterized protein n=1 Tax=Araneus ventricosus TaxID=182803 RepID=A0A4Y2BH12_ARAVE|nr:hypothetical protein AVEN_203490-1 [Araneus ventricosus]